MTLTLIPKAFSAAVLALLLAGPLRANEGYKGDADEWAADRAVDKLDLGREGREKLREARKEHREKMKGIWERKDELMDALKRQVDAKASDSEIEDTLKKLKDVKVEMRDEEERYHDKLGEILTPMQRAKMLLEMKGKMKRPTEMK